MIKFKIDRELLEDAFDSVLGAVPRRTPKDILLTVQIKAYKNNVELRATDLDIGIVSKFEGVEIEQEGTINILASKMAQVLKKSKDDIISIEEKDGKIKIKSGKNRFNFLISDPEDFPDIEDFSSDNIVTVESGLLKDLIQKTIFSISSDTTRWALNGVLFNLKENKLETVATDAKRLSHFTCELENKFNFEISVIIPVLALKEVSKLLGEDDVDIVFKENKVFFRIENSYLVTRVVDGKFPPFRQIIPSSLKDYNKISISKNLFSRAIEQASIFIDDASFSIKIEIEGDKIKFKSRNHGFGNSEINIEIDNAVGEKIIVGVNPYYILDFLKVCSQETIEFYFKDSKSMIVFIETNEKKFKHLVMPVSLEF